MIDFKNQIIWLDDPDGPDFKGITVHEFLTDYAKNHQGFEIRWNGDPWDENKFIHEKVWDK